MLLFERLKERGLKRLLVPARDGTRKRVHRAQRYEVELVRVRLVPLLDGCQSSAQQRKLNDVAHAFSSAGVHPAQRLHQGLALIERVAVLGIVLVDVER